MTTHTSAPALPHPDPDVLIAELSKLYDNNADIDLWLNSKQPLLGNRIPADLIGTPHGFAEVLAIASAINDGAYL